MSELTEFQLEALEDIIENTLNIRSDILPSEWYEKTIVTPPGNALPRISYKNTPFWIKPVNCFHPNHPAKDITIMSIAQGGKTMMFINAGVAYSIAHNPQHMLYLTGQTELTKDAVGRLDEILAACDLSKFINDSIISLTLKLSKLYLLILNSIEYKCFIIIIVILMNDLIKGT